MKPFRWIVQTFKHLSPIIITIVMGYTVFSCWVSRPQKSEPMPRAGPKFQEFASKLSDAKLQGYVFKYCGDESKDAKCNSLMDEMFRRNENR